MSDHPDDDVPDTEQSPEQHPAPDGVPESEDNPASGDVPDSEQAEYEAGPADWHELVTRPTDQLEHEMRELHLVWKRHSYAAWLSLMRNIPRVRALKEHYGGDVFATKCRMLCRIGKNAAGNIVRWGIAEPAILNGIWSRVHAEAHAASVKGNRYEYPTLNKMCLWYKPEEDVTQEVSEEDEENLRNLQDDLQNALSGARSDEESNDPRSKAEIAKQNIMLEDHNKTLTRKQVQLEQRLADRDADYDKVSQLATEQRNSLARLRQMITELNDGLAAKDAEIAAKDVEIARLRAEAITQKQTNESDPDPQPDETEPDEPEPDPEPPTPQPSEPWPQQPEPQPEPVEQAKPNFELVDVNAVLHTRMGDVPPPSEYELHHGERQWNIRPFRGGKISPERRMLARCNRVRAFKVLEQLLAWPDCDAAAKHLEKLTLRNWLRDDFEDLNLEILLDIPTD